MDQPLSDPGHCFEIRLFYVRLSRGAALPRLALALHPAGDAASLALPLRLDRHNPASGEAAKSSPPTVSSPILAVPTTTSSPPTPLPSTPPPTKTLDPSSSRNRRPAAAAPMRQAFEEISDDEWSHHTFKPSRVLKRPHRAAQPASQPPPPIDSFRYNRKPSSTAGTSTATFVLSDDDDDFDLGEEDRSRGAGRSSRLLKRPPQHRSPPAWGPPSIVSFRYNPKPSTAAAAVRISDDDFDLADDDDDFDLPASRKSRPRRTTGLRLTTASVDLSEEDEDLDLANLNTLVALCVKEVAYT